MPTDKPRKTSHVSPPTVLDPAACDDCALVPGSLQRVRQMQALREQGWSLDEIALRFGVSRERVRQILHAHGGPAAQDIADARRRRAEVQAEERVDELLALWRMGEQPRSAADKLGLQAVACRSTIDRFATDVDRAARRASMAGARRMQTYSDRDIIVALTSVSARVGRVPSAKEYAAHARALNYPSLPTVLNRMGGWARALDAAGMHPLSAPARRRKRRWTEESCWDALRTVADELGEIPTVLSYERHANGRPELPSAATLRNRLGRWSSITTQLAAQRELAQVMQTASPSSPMALSARAV
jgi:transcriptional regulator with XRE-family HTH domain